MDFSRITDSLYVGTTPGRSDYGQLHRLGVKLVINMRALRGRAPHGSAPGMDYLRLRTFDNPLLPIPTPMLAHGTRAALRVIAEGGSVYTHCSRGRHRSVAMAAAILIALGHSPEAAMEFIKRQRPVADPDASHIRPRILDFARWWQAQGR